MSDTATKTKDGNKAAQKKENKAKPTTATPITPTGAAVDSKAAAPATAPATEKKEKRKPKNYTPVSLNVNDPTSAGTWLTAFIKQCDDHPPIAGYDQHWNDLGFIHTGPSERLSNEGCGRMAVVLFDTLARRSQVDDAKGKEAGEMLNFLMTFGANRKAELVAESEAAVLAAAAKIEAARKGK